MENFTPLEENVWISWVRAHQSVMSYVEEEFKKHSFEGLEWYDALLELSRAPDRRLRLSELANRMLLKRFNVTRLVDRLEKAGFVERVPCPQDARGAYAVLTPEGHAARKKMWPIYRDAVRACFLARLSPDELAALRRSLLLLQPTV